ncbi:hypothetical protein [Methylobacterium sp. SI9]|uniref:hypothetical protein n=1 Tax=Methylobacterium guangdongense TaxID=3138811 RepID=UPI00313BB25E
MNNARHIDASSFSGEHYVTYHHVFFQLITGQTLKLLLNYRLSESRRIAQLDRRDAPPSASSDRRMNEVANTSEG